MIRNPSNLQDDHLENKVPVPVDSSIPCANGHPSCNGCGDEIADCSAFFDQLDEYYVSLELENCGGATTSAPSDSAREPVYDTSAWIASWDKIASETVTVRKPEVTTDTAVIQLSNKRQDYAEAGVFCDYDTDNIGSFIFVADGHGSDNVINRIRQVKMAPHMPAKSPLESMQTQLTTERVCPRGITSGATAAYAKVYADHIEIGNIGDAHGFIFKDDQLIAESEDQDWDSESERARLTELYGEPLTMPSRLSKHSQNMFLDANSSRVVIEPCCSIKAETPTCIRQISASYIHYPFQQAMDGGVNQRAKLAPSQALGHHGRTGTTPNIINIPIVAGSRYRVVLVSDGITDMMNTKSCQEDVAFLATQSAAAITELGRTRWQQEWQSYMDLDGNTFEQKVKFTKSVEFDDVCAAVADIVV